MADPADHLTDEEFAEVYPSGSRRRRNMKIDERISYHQRRIEELEQHAARWGVDDDYALCSVIYFSRTYHPKDCQSLQGINSFHFHQKYDFAAIKASNGYWYITGAHTQRMTWEELISKHLSLAVEETGEVYLVTEMALL